jgi:hypothetical protein
MHRRAEIKLRRTYNYSVMIKMQLNIQGVTITMERDDSNISSLLDDYINLMFLAGKDTIEIEKEILLAAEKIIKSHQKNESTTNQDSCNI